MIVCECGSKSVETKGRAVGDAVIRVATCAACNRGFLYEWPRLGSAAIVTRFDAATDARYAYARRVAP